MTDYNMAATYRTLVHVIKNAMRLQQICLSDMEDLHDKIGKKIKKILKSVDSTPDREFSMRKIILDLVKDYVTNSKTIHPTDIRSWYFIEWDIGLELSRQIPVKITLDMVSEPESEPDPDSDSDSDSGRDIDFITEDDLKKSNSERPAAISLELDEDYLGMDISVLIYTDDTPDNLRKIINLANVYQIPSFKINYVDLKWAEMHARLCEFVPHTGNDISHTIYLPILGFQEMDHEVIKKMMRISRNGSYSYGYHDHSNVIDIWTGQGYPKAMDWKTFLNGGVFEDDCEDHDEYPENYKW